MRSKNVIATVAKQSLFSCVAGKIPDCFPAEREISRLGNDKFTPLLAMDYTCRKIFSDRSKNQERIARSEKYNWFLFPVHEKIVLLTWTVRFAENP